MPLHCRPAAGTSALATNRSLGRDDQSRQRAAGPADGRQAGASHAVLCHRAPIQQVFGGGPVLTANPEPYADFFDVVLLGRLLGKPFNLWRWLVAC